MFSFAQINFYILIKFGLVRAIYARINLNQYRDGWAKEKSCVGAGMGVTLDR